MTASRRCARVAAALHAGVERTATQDVGYGLRQLTDVAIRALSPGINDPTTAVHALQSCTAVLCEAAGQRLGQRILRDEDGVVRVVVARPIFPICSTWSVPSRRSTENVIRWSWPVF